MQEALLLVFLVVLLILLLNYVCRSNDGFTNPTGEPQASFVTDRLKQYNTVGISLITADKAGALGNSANNLTATTPITTQNNAPLNTTDTGMFALAKTCERVVAGFDTLDCGIFDDPAFAQNCGLCLDVGRTSKGASIPGGGLILLAEDKINAMDKNVSDFMPNYVASVGFCPAGKMVSTKAECIKLQRQLKCQKNKSFDLPGCSQCYSDNSYSIVDPTEISGSGTLSIVGSGILSLQDGGNTVSNQALSATPYVYRLQSGEGSTLRLNVSPTTPTSSVSIAGIITGATFNGEFTSDLRKMIFADGSYKPRSSGQTTINGNPATIMTPLFGQKNMSLTGTIPFTFVSTISQEASLCNDGPYATLASSATQDPCYARGAGPGTYSVECLQNIWMSNGCTQSGQGYPRAGATAASLMANLDGSFRSSNDIADFIYNKALIASTGIDQGGNKQTLTNWSAASVFCTGVSIPSPCEGPTKITGPLSVDCLNYLWTNSGLNNPLGATYSGFGNSLTSGSPTPVYCQAAGTYAPVNANGATNQGAVDFWQRQGGVDAVKAVMSSIYANANAATSTDAVRQPFFKQCYGDIAWAARPQAPPPAPPAPPPAPPAPVCQPSSDLGLPPCQDISVRSGGIIPACGEVVNVYGKPNFSEFNFTIPIGQWNTIDEIRSMPRNRGYTIHGGDGNVSFVFPSNCNLKLTINNGPNFSGPVTYVFTRSCAQSILSGACGQITFDRRWTYAQSIKCERV